MFESRFTPEERAERFMEMCEAAMEFGMAERARRHFHTAMEAARGAGISGRWHET